MTTLLKYCDCSVPAETDQQFCPLCGAEYQDAPLEFADRLAVGERLGVYLVTERQGMWALLEDTDGTCLRFWPTGDTSAKSVQPHGAELQDAGPAEQASASPFPVNPLPEEDEAPVVQSAPASEGSGAELPAEPSDGGPAPTAAPEEPLEHAPVLSADPPEPLEVPELRPPPGDHHDQPETRLPVPPVAAPPTDMIHLRHFTFLPTTAVVLGDIPGHLEPERPEKFTGKKTLSLRNLMDQDPTGDDRPPARLLSWLVQCAQAMNSAHDQGILVNSFTPDTVFVDYDVAGVKAERIAISTGLHAASFGDAHRVAGYVPQGDEPLSPRTDVYQVGALLRDLIGWRPDQIGGDDPEALSRQPMPLVRLLLHLMHPDPEKRPAGAEELKKLLVETQQAFASQHILDVAGMTDVGLNREHNEDAFGFLQFEENAGRGQLSTTILVVCDGVGGANAGEEASRMAIHQVLSALSASAGSALPVPERLEDAILQANTRLLTLSAEHRGASCTIAVVYIRAQEYWVAHAGDSRAYVSVNGVLQALTADHSWTAQQVRKGLLTAEEAGRHDNAHMIYRSLGERDRLEIEIQPVQGPGFPLEAGSVFLLCTDGVTDVLTEEHLQGILASSGRSPRDKARHCVQAANTAGGPDNITALVAIQEINP